MTIYLEWNGVPTSCIERYATVHNISVKELHSTLFNNESIEFDLTNDNNKCVFRNNKDHAIYYLYEGQNGTTRTCKCVRNENYKIVINSMLIVFYCLIIYNERDYKRSLWN